MAENLKRRPKKSILKNSSSFDKQEQQHNAKKQKETKWDEMNIIATLHPADKDYGHMKIQEPKTPFNYMEDDTIEELDASELAERIRIASEQPKTLQPLESDDDSDEELTEDQKKKKKEFELKRKKHYNEFHALQLAKKLLEEDEDDEDPQEQSTSSKAVSPSNRPVSPSNRPNKKM